MRAPGVAAVARGELRLVEHDVAQQAAEEVAPALLGQHSGRAARIEPEGARQRARQPVDRRSLLRARGEVDAAQERGGVELGAAEGRLDEAVEHGFERGELGGESRDAGALLGSALVLQALQHAVLQPLQQAGEFAAESPGVALGPTSAGKVMPQTWLRASRSRSSKNSVKPTTRSTLLTTK